MSQKILYLSAHSVLEYLEVKMFYELGYEIFSPGAYVEPLNPGDSTLRPAIDGLVYNPDILAQWHKLAATCSGEDAKNHLTKEFVDNFDIIIVMHLPRWITENWDAIKHKRVIWRTIGQSIASVEQQLYSFRQMGLEIVRYSPMEWNIPGFIGSDAMIRFYVDTDEYQVWVGDKQRVITFGQSMKQRDQACNFTFFEEVTRPFDRHLFGPGNEGVGPWTTGKVSYEEQKKELKHNRVYFYTGTHPASYTLNFMEALAAGIPIVAIGYDKGNAKYFHNHRLYEIPQLLNNGINGFISDHPQELRDYIGVLLENSSIARTISNNARKTAKHHFGKEMIYGAWKHYLDNGPRRS